MPFLGQDWRSPGWRWIKTEDGWKRSEPCSSEFEDEGNPLNDINHAILLNSDEEICSTECEFASKKRKKDHFRNTAKSQCFYRENWIYVHKESTRERHGYCTLGEAFNRLDFSSAIQDIRRFNYVVKLLQLIAKSQLTSLSGAAQKNYFNILDKIVQKGKAVSCSWNFRFVRSAPKDCLPVGLLMLFVEVILINTKDYIDQITCSFEACYGASSILTRRMKSVCTILKSRFTHLLVYIFQFSFQVLEDQYNPRLIKDLLQDLSSTLCMLIRSVGKSVLVGNINIWICRLETILMWQQQLSNLQMTKHINNGLTLSDLPLHMLNNILHRFSDGWDIITLGQVTPTLYMLSEDRQLWKKLCQYHFAEKQFCRHLILSEKGHIDWKLMYFALQKCYPIKEQYGDTLQFCRHCSILFWKDTGHPCTANDPTGCFTPVSPQHFIDLFKF